MRSYLNEARTIDLAAVLDGVKEKQRRCTWKLKVEEMNERLVKKVHNSGNI